MYACMYVLNSTDASFYQAAVKEFRAAELKREILNSNKLKSYFAENPNDLRVLRHDKAVLHPIRQQVFHNKCRTYDQYPTTVAYYYHFHPHKY